MSTPPGAHRGESAPDGRPSPATTRRHGGHHLPLPVDQVGRPTDLRLQLPDSRFLAYAEHGDPDGRPLLFFHGTYGSRRMGQVLDATAAELGIHVIAPERPGYGLSDYQPNRSLAVPWSR